MSDAEAPDPALDLDAEDWPDAPRHWEADVVAADGGIVHLRPIRPGDADALVTFHAGLSQRTRYLRYFSAYPRGPRRVRGRAGRPDHRCRPLRARTGHRRGRGRLRRRRRPPGTRHRLGAAR